MSDKFQFGLVGDKRIDRMFAELPKRMQKKVVRQGVRAGGKVLLAAAKANAPVLSGRLRKSLKLRVSPRPRKDAYRMRVTTGTREELGIPSDEKSYYPAAVEYGHAIVKDGALVGTVPPNPFLRRAFDEKKEEAQNVSTSLISEGIVREALSIR